MLTSFSAFRRRRRRRRRLLSSACRLFTMSSNNVSAEQLQQQMLVMQQQFTASQQAMTAEMQQMVQENQRLRAAAAAAAPSGPSSSSSSQPTVTVPVPRIEMRLMQPSSFHGHTSSNATQWLMEVERYFMASNMVSDSPESSRMRILYASTFLKDSASVWYSSTTAANELDPNRDSWDTFKNKFLSRFQPIAAAKVARAQLRLLKQRHRVAGYSQEFLRLIQMIPDMNLADQLEQYIVGLQHDVAIEVDKKDPQSLSEAMEYAQRYELMASGRRQAYGRAPVGIYNFGGRSASSSSHQGGGGGGGDRMDLSAIHSNPTEDAQDFYYGADYSTNGGASSLSSTNSTNGAESSLSSTLEHVLNGMFQRVGFNPSKMGTNRNKHKRGGGGGGGGSLPSGMSKEEYSKLMKEGKCFHCKQTGHLARHCPTKPKN